MKNQNIVCIFAHPDDESFGPSGTIANWAINSDVYIICVTDGSNPNEGNKDLALIRKKELETSSKILGVKKVFFLNYCDGELRNNIYHKVADDIKIILQKIKPTTLLTFEGKGVSGHLDHIFVTMVTNYLFQKLKFIRKIYYFAEFKLISKLMKNYFIYFPEGYSEKDVDHIEIVNKVWDQKVEAIKAHKSQWHDGKKVLLMKKLLPKKELFFVRQK